MENKLGVKKLRFCRRTGAFKTCIICKQNFYVTYKRINSALYCSMNCYHKYRREHNPLIGFKHSEKSKENYRKKIFTKTHRYNLSKSAKGKYVSEITRDKIRKNTINQHIKGLFPQTNTLIERIMEKELKYNNIKFEHPFPFGRFVCDFAIPEKKLIIECDGDYWHNREDVKKKDLAKNSYLKVAGWKVIRFWEHEIKSDITYCVKRIKEEL